MPLPSLYRSGEPTRAWNIAHAAGYGAVLGALAAAFKTLGPFHAGAGNLAAGHLAGSLVEIAVAAVAFALLCAAAALLRNFIARRLIWHDGR